MAVYFDEQQQRWIGKHDDCELCERVGWLVRSRKKEKNVADKSITIGDEVKDKITGFQGIVVAKTEWLNGCIRLSLQPRALHEGRPVGTESFDIEQVELITRGAVTTKEEPTGGPMPDVARPSVPR